MSDGKEDRHDHGGAPHRHDAIDTPGQRLKIALALTGTFMVVEVFAGFATGSLALLSDAGHMLTDAGALVLALVAQSIARKNRSSQKTFGYRRAEILAALMNGIVLGASSLWISVEAVRRLHEPSPVEGLPMLIVAAVGLVLNIVSALVLSRGGHENANLRAATAHVTADAAGSVAAILAGLAVWLFGWNIADPIISLAISVLILWSAWKLVREALSVLMEGTPSGLDVRALEKTIRDVPGVASVHDLHVWAISDGFVVVTVHVILANNVHGTDVAAAVASHVRDTHGIEHVTVQPEPPSPPLLPASSLVKPMGAKDNRG